MARLLITGGAGFIGSHTCVVLLGSGHDLVVLDNFSNSSPIALERVASLAGLSTPLRCVKADLRDAAAVNAVFAQEAEQGQPIDAVIHFAGLKAVGESVKDPLRYWDVNVGGTRTLLSAMQSHGCHTLVFSSSATLYGYPRQVPIPESAPSNRSTPTDKPKRRWNGCSAT